MRKRSRRRFFKRSTAAVGVAAVWSSIISSSALSRGTSVPPSERIKMGPIGLGGQDALQRDASALAPMIVRVEPMKKDRP